MTLRIFDTMQRRVVPLEVGSTVRMYVCGITPYDAAHLGHAATYLTYDLLVRRLEELGHEVSMVRNVTDVDDSILPKARELGVDYLELAATELEKFQADMAKLDLRAPMAEPRATEAVADILDLVAQLLASGHAYEAGGAVYFDIATAPGFGELSGYPRDQMLELAAARAGRPDDPHKRDPLDFVLWQPSAPDEPAWEAPFGSGRPGWHIECSAMALRFHGSTLDLHGGGTDLIFPHHECERVQSEAITGKPFARHWVHTAMVSYEGEKMSKSLGNLVFVGDLMRTTDPRAVRLALMRHHYRAGFEWHDSEVQESTALLQRLLAAAGRSEGADPRPYAARARAAIDDDLDTPGALEALDDLASATLSGGGDANAPVVLREVAGLLGIDLARPSA